MKVNNRLGKIMAVVCLSTLVSTMVYADNTACSGEGPMCQALNDLVQTAQDQTTTPEQLNAKVAAYESVAYATQIQPFMSKDNFKPYSDPTSSGTQYLSTAFMPFSAGSSSYAATPPPSNASATFGSGSFLHSSAPAPTVKKTNFSWLN